jgi:predicted dehydrogenase
MSEKLRVGVVGTGGWADAVHLPALANHPRAAVVALCGRNREHAKEIAGKHAIPDVFTDYRDMIARANLQALVVATTDALHYPVTMAALDAGLHVLCEKPLALKADEARAMYEKAEAAGVKHMVMFTNRWLPPHRYLRQLVDEGFLGRPLHCQLSSLAEYGRRPGYAWRFDRTQSNGILGDLGSHLIDLARWYVGDIARVSAHLGAFFDHPGPEGQPPRPANDAALLLIEFANGAQGTIHVTAVAHVRGRGQDQHLALFGEGGTLELDLVDGTPTLQGARQETDRFSALTVPDELWGDVNLARSYIPRVDELYRKQPVGARAFVDAILEDQPAAPSFYDGYQAQKVIDAAIASHEQGRWIAIA